MTVGKDLNQALYAAVYLEEAAKCYLAARAACVNGEIKQMSDAQIQQMVDVFQYLRSGHCQDSGRSGKAHRLTNLTQTTNSLS